MLAAATLLTLRPWDSDSDSTALQLPDPPRYEAGLGDAIAAAPGGGPAIAGARVAPAGIAVPVVDPVAVPGPVSIPQLAVSPARPVSVSRSVDVPSPPAGTAPPAAPAPTPTTPAPQPAPPLQTSLPVSTPTPVSPPPVSSAGGGAEEEGEGEEEAVPVVEACEGEEYSIFVSFDAETMEPLEVLIRQLDEDGEESEVSFEGEALDEALELVDLLVAVEGCEWTEVEPASP
ncbi:MAG TPA: hypothetical protein VF259_04350 [Solirubrobacterales bacterium]